jgi:hypothetical protein
VHWVQSLMPFGHHGGVVCTVSCLMRKRFSEVSLLCKHNKYLDDILVLEEGVQYHLTMLFYVGCMNFKKPVL